MTITLGDLRTQLQNMIHRDDLPSSPAQDFILNSAIGFIQKFNLFRADTVTTTLESPAITSGSVGVMTMALPSDFKAYVSIRQIAPSYRFRFGLISKIKGDNLWNLAVNTTDNFVDSFIVNGTNLEAYPPYNATTNYALGYWKFVMTYHQFVEPLVDETDHNYWTDNYGDVIIQFAIPLTLAWKQEYDDAVEYLQSSYAVLLRALVTESSEQISGLENELHKQVPQIISQIHSAKLLNAYSYPSQRLT